MKNLKINFLAVLMAFAAMPAWGMGSIGALAHLAAPLLSLAYIFNAMPQNGLLPCEGQDAQALDALCKSAFGFKLGLRPGYKYPAYVWKENNTIVGAFFFNQESKKVTYLHTLAVKPDVQRTGIGSKMLNAITEIRAATCPSSTCQLKLRSVPSALKFYEKNGFTCDQNKLCYKEFASTMKDLESEKTI
jgi:GNAT superfamily N-acetyltransferase